MSSIAATRARLLARVLPALRRAPSIQYSAFISHRKFSASANFHSDDEVASTPRAPVTSTTIESDKEALEIQSMIQRVHELCATAQYADALPIAKDVRKRAFHHFGSPSPVFASCVNNHALILKALGRLDEAANLFDLALLNYESGVGKQHPSYLTALANLANVQMARRKFEEARQLFQDILNTRLEVLPNDHQDIAQSRYQLAGALRQLGRLEEAYQLQKDALKMLQRKYGSDHLLSATAMNNLALTCKALALKAAVPAQSSASDVKTMSPYLDEAKDLLEDACGVRHRSLGVKHPDYVSAVYNLREIYLARGEDERAERVRQHIMSIFGENESPKQS